MSKVIHFLSKNLPILIVFTAVFTYLSPYYWDAPPLIPRILLGTVIYFTGISMNISTLKEIRSKKREILLAALLKYTVMVFLSIALALLFFSSYPDIAAGIILAGTVPAGTTAAVYSLLAGGNVSLVVAGSLIDVVISPIVTPLAMLVLAKAHVSVSFWSLFQSFFLIVVLPLSLGLLTQKNFPKMAFYSKSAAKLGSALAILLIVHTVIGSGKEAIGAHFDLLLLLFVVTFLQVFLAMVLGYYLAKKLRMAESDARAMLFHVGLANTALAAILAYQFLSEAAVIGPIFCMVINLALGAFFANYFAKKEIVVQEK